VKPGREPYEHGYNRGLDVERRRREEWKERGITAL